MKDNYTEIIVIIDASGSMQSIREDVIGGFNTFIGEQKKVPGEAKVTLVSFNNVHQTIYDGKDVQAVGELTDKSYIPQGMTALYDAIGSTIDRVGERLAAMKEEDRPGKVIMAIITDGDENSSREYTHKQVFDKIKLQTDIYNWQFVYLAANQDAMKVANNMGISSKNAANFTADSRGIGSTYAVMSNSVTAYRNTGVVDLSQDNK